MLFFLVYIWCVKIFFVHSKAYCLDLRLGAKDLFMHKKHSLHALNIKITILGLHFNFIIFIYSTYKSLL
jgi:hypothetical protein